MKAKTCWFALVASLFSSVFACADNPASDEAKIRQAVDSYVAAYNQGDAKALAALWSPEAFYTHPDTGDQAAGREAIEKLFAGIFATAICAGA